MGMLKEILIDAEDALRAMQDDLLVEGVTIDELKFNHLDQTFYIMIATDGGEPRYFAKPRSSDRVILIGPLAYGLGVHGAFELTDQLPQLIENIAD